MADLVPMSPALDALVNAASKAVPTPQSISKPGLVSSMPLSSTTVIPSDLPSPLGNTRSLQTSYITTATPQQSSLTGMSILQLTTQGRNDDKTLSSYQPSPLRPPLRSPTMLSRQTFPMLASPPISSSTSTPSSLSTITSIAQNMTPLSSLAAAKMGLRRRSSVSVYDPSHLAKRPRTSFTSPILSSNVLLSTPRSSPTLPPAHAVYALTQAASIVTEEEQSNDVDDTGDMEDDDTDESPPYSPTHHKKKLNAQQQAAAAAAAASNDAGGSSCHQCKSRRSFIDLTYCTSNLNKKNKNAVCRKKYCEHCLKKFYKEVPAPANQSKTWKCPSCRKICCCAACRRREQRDHDETTPRGTPTMSPVSQQHHIQDASFQPASTSPPIPPRTLTRPHSQRPSTSQFARPQQQIQAQPLQPPPVSPTPKPEVIVKMENIPTEEPSHETTETSSSTSTSTQSSHTSSTSTSTLPPSHNEHDGDGESESSDNVEREKNRDATKQATTRTSHDRNEFFLLYAVGQLPHVQMTVRDIMARTEQTMKQKLQSIQETFDRVMADAGDPEKQNQVLVTV